MNELVSLRVVDGVAIVTIDNPPVNAIGPGVPEGIGSSIAAAAADASVAAIVMMGAGRTFIAGADIREFGKVVSGEKPRINLLPLLLEIEECPKPVVMAIHGTALGGGMEVAMAGHYRVATPSAQVGQPEVKLGIIPGAAGTQRLPRLAGVAKAVEMCAFGESIGAGEAHALGIVDALIEGDLLEGAMAFARAVVGKPLPKTRERNEKLGACGRGGLRACPRAGCQNATRADCAAGRDRCGGSRHTAAVRGWVCARGRDLRRLFALHTIAVPDSRLFRRARGVADSRCSRGYRDPGDPPSGGDWRGDHGRRHHDELRQRRHSGDREGNDAGGARPGHEHDPAQLRQHSEEGPDDRGRDGAAAGDDHAATHV